MRRDCMREGKAVVPGVVVMLLLALTVLVSGCGSLAFYENTKVAIALTLDPSAPEPVEISAAYKEGVYALVPTRTISEDEVSIVRVGEILADFDVRYGVNAGATEDRARDFLYAVITQGLATGPAATILATRGERSVLQARRTIIAEFLAGLDMAGLQKISDALAIGGGSPDETTLRRRLSAEVRRAPEATLKDIEDKLEDKFPMPKGFKRYSPKPS
jgi:hypothetical protein